MLPCYVVGYGSLLPSATTRALFAMAPLTPMAVMPWFVVEVVTTPDGTTLSATLCTLPLLLPIFILSLRSRVCCPNARFLVAYMKTAAPSASATLTRAPG